MNRHEGVSCDNCMRENFAGKRYKCLSCYDYDLCAACYDARASNTRHDPSHPMQCILTRADYELYYGGEAFTNVDQFHSYACPFCGCFGYSQTTLQEHVATDHTDMNYEVICPICASMPGGDPNMMTDDFLSHMNLVHRVDSRDVVYFLDEHSAQNVRRNYHAPHLTGRSGQSRNRRSSMNFSVFNSRGITSITPAPREPTGDPISELLSQLSVRRTSSNMNSTTQALAELQMQMLQSERRSFYRNPARSLTAPHSFQGTNVSVIGPVNAPSTTLTPPQPPPPTKPKPVPKSSSKYLLAKILEDQSAAKTEEARAEDRAEFAHQMLLSSLLAVDGEENARKAPFPHHRRTLLDADYAKLDEGDEDEARVLDIRG